MAISKKLREKIRMKYGGRCAYCGKEMGRTFQVDHIKSQYMAKWEKECRVHEEDNLNPACRRCNNYKLSWSLEELRRELSQQVIRARRSSLNFRLAEDFGLITETNAPVVFYFEKEPE